MSDDIVVRRDGVVATVTINRPDQRNAIKFEMWQRFAEVFEELDADPDLRVVLLTGAGDKAFSAGADIKDFEETRSTPEKQRRYKAAVERACEALVSMSKPTVVVARGYLVGGGFELAIHADMRVGDDTVQVGLPAAKRGIAVGHAMASRIEHLAGAANASYLLLTARFLNAQDAKMAGLLNAVVPPDELDGFVEALVKDLAETSPMSHRMHKGVLRDLVEYGAVELIPEERRALPSQADDSEDFHEGVASFKEKRPPRFTGR